MKVRFLLTKEEFEAIKELNPAQGRVFIEAIFDVDFDIATERAQIGERIEELSKGNTSRVIIDLIDLLQVVARINDYVVTDDLDGF